jgi:hypothetical protein
MRIACWIPEATGIHSEYVELIAFQLHQWLHERPSLLRTLPALLTNTDAVWHVRYVTGIKNLLCEG